MYGREGREGDGKGGFLGIEGRELVDELWVDLADSVDVKQTWVLESLEDLVVDVVDIGGIVLFIVLLGEGHVGVGVVGSGGGDVELGGGEMEIVLGGEDVCVSVLVIAVGLWVRVESGWRDGEKAVQGLYSFDTYVLPKTGYPAVVLCVDVATPAGEGEGEEGGGRGRGRERGGGLGDGGGGGGQGGVCGEGRPGAAGESGVGYRLEGRRVYRDVDPAPLRARRLDVVVIVGGGDGGRRGVGGVGGVGVGEGRGVRSLSFRLETGRSPGSRMHLTEGRQRIQEMFKW